VRTKVLIIVGGGGWGRQALEIIPALDPAWEKTYLATLDNLWWYERHPLDGTLHMVPRLRPAPGGTLPARVFSLGRTLCGIIRLLWRLRPHLIIGICSDLSVPVMLLGRLVRSRTYYVESLTRVRTPSRTSRILQRLKAVDRIFVQHESLVPALPRAVYVGGVL
jgi:UDP-N-acetylglucosamine:LPS N-acetylglucosamine transferase